MTTQGTITMQSIPEGGDTARAILYHVYRALQDKGYNPESQLVGYILTGDPTYITSHNNARSMICRLERDEILDELVRYYISGMDT